MRRVYLRLQGACLYTEQFSPDGQNMHVPHHPWPSMATVHILGYKMQSDSRRTILPHAVPRQMASDNLPVTGITLKPVALVSPSHMDHPRIVPPRRPPRSTHSKQRTRFCQLARRLEVPAARAGNIGRRLIGRNCWPQKMAMSGL